MAYLLSALAAFLVALLLWFPAKVWELLLDGLASFLEWIPVPEFMQDLGSLFSSLDPAILYFTAPMQLGTGVTMILGAAAIRFVIRRIPVVG